jgi:hypothetical protein
MIEVLEYLLLCSINWPALFLLQNLQEKAQDWV